MRTRGRITQYIRDYATFFNRTSVARVNARQHARRPTLGVDATRERLRLISAGCDLLTTGGYDIGRAGHLARRQMDLRRHSSFL